MNTREALERMKDATMHDAWYQVYGAVTDHSIPYMADYDAVNAALQRLEDIEKDVARYFELKKTIYKQGPHSGAELAEFMDLEDKLRNQGGTL